MIISEMKAGKFICKRNSILKNTADLSVEAANLGSLSYPFEVFPYTDKRRYMEDKIYNNLSSPLVNAKDTDKYVMVVPTKVTTDYLRFIMLDRGNKSRL